MKTKQLYIHIGPHKTGTTAIQSAFSLNMDYFKSRGITCIKLHKYLGISKFFTYSDDSPDIAFDDVRMFLKDAIENDDSSVFVICAEALCGTLSEGYISSLDRATKLRRLLSSDINPLIIAYVRRQDRLLQSGYSQIVKEGYSNSFEEYFAGITDINFNFKTLLDNYSSIFGRENILACLYDPESFTGMQFGVIDDFFSRLSALTGRDINVAELRLGRSFPNISYSPQVLKLAKMVNKYLTIDDRRKMLLLFERCSAAGKIFDEHPPLPREIGLAIYNMYAESNLAAFREYVRDGDVSTSFLRNDYSDENVKMEQDTDSSVEEEEIPLSPLVKVVSYHDQVITLCRRRISDTERAIKALEEYRDTSHTRIDANVQAISELNEGLTKRAALFRKCFNNNEQALSSLTAQQAVFEKQCAAISRAVGETTQTLETLSEHCDTSTHRISENTQAISNAEKLLGQLVVRLDDIEKSMTLFTEQQAVHREQLASISKTYYEKVLNIETVLHGNMRELARHATTISAIERNRKIEKGKFEKQVRDILFPNWIQRKLIVLYDMALRLLRYGKERTMLKASVYDYFVNVPKDWRKRLFRGFLGLFGRLPEDLN